jgi:hypothetical protein
VQLQREHARPRATSWSRRAGRSRTCPRGPGPWSGCRSSFHSGKLPAAMASWRSLVAWLWLAPARRR